LNESSRDRELPEQILIEYTQIIQDAETVSFVPRASELQEQAVADLTRYLDKLASTKAGYVKAGNEECANACLALECMVSALRAELQMWLCLKTDRSEEAWNHLINAEDYAAAAVRAHRIGQLAERRLPLYEVIERFIFPPQAFTSAGYIAVRRHCSICGKQYDECEHVGGRPYLGVFCSAIVEQLDLKEISYVTEPADKRCRVTHFSVGEKWRNKMTWRLEDRE